MNLSDLQSDNQIKIMETLIGIIVFIVVLSFLNDTIRRMLPRSMDRVMRMGFRYLLIGSLNAIYKMIKGIISETKSLRK